MRIALGLLVVLLPFAAQASEYTLADANGVPSCNVVILILKHQLASGIFYSRNCDPPAPDSAGSGVLTKVQGSSDSVWSFGVTAPAKGTSLYLFDIKALTWVQYYEKGRNPLQVVRNGVLLHGSHKPPASAPVK